MGSYNGYKNSHGTIFTIDGSHGMINMHHKIGGSDDVVMLRDSSNLIALVVSRYRVHDVARLKLCCIVLGHSH